MSKIVSVGVWTQYDTRILISARRLIETDPAGDNEDGYEEDDEDDDDNSFRLSPSSSYHSLSSRVELNLLDIEEEEEEDPDNPIQSHI